MKMFVIAVGAAALLAGSSLAALADSATATIASIDATTGAMSLSNGKTYYVSANGLLQLMVGQTVTVTYTADATGKMTASNVEPEQEYR